MSRGRVVVGMSGGVDSSVAAALLLEEGYEVVGIAMRLWGDASGSGCCSLDDFLDARRVATRLGVSFYVMDFRAEFERQVVAPFVDEYLAGRTPNPCARCNQFVKFGDLWTRARELGADWIATGHYARVRHPACGGRSELLAASDPAKDQSYYLFGIEPDVLARTLFPVGGLSKPAVRERARALGLGVAEKPDSQEICFAPKGAYAEFVAAYSRRPEGRPGTIVGEDGAVLGHHDGVHRFTVGQRRGLGISAPEPLYVVGIDATSGTVTVGSKNATVAGGLVATGVNWLTEEPPPPGSALTVKIRSRFSGVAAVLTEAAPDRFAVMAADGLPAVTPGQAAVLYEGDRVIGGGWIARALPVSPRDSA